MLAFMINPSFGAPAFAARLIPVRINAEFVGTTTCANNFDSQMLRVCILFDVRQSYGKSKRVLGFFIKPIGV